MCQCVEVAGNDLGMGAVTGVVKQLAYLLQPRVDACKRNNEAYQHETPLQRAACVLQMCRVHGDGAEGCCHVCHRSNATPFPRLTEYGPTMLLPVVPNGAVYNGARMRDAIPADDGVAMHAAACNRV